MGISLEEVVESIAQTAIKREDYFSELDGICGDGDFGYSLARGFERVLEEWNALDRTLPGNFLKDVAKIIMKEVGGVSGSIWGTAFLRAGKALGLDSAITRDNVVPVLRAVIEGIKVRGNCELGDKTYLDTLIPTVDAIERAIDEDQDSASIFKLAAEASYDAAEKTRTMLAKRGRASYTGERSIGTLDAGSVALAEMIQAIYQKNETKGEK